MSDQVKDGVLMCLLVRAAIEERTRNPGKWGDLQETVQQELSIMEPEEAKKMLGWFIRDYMVLMGYILSRAVMPRDLGAAAEGMLNSLTMDSGISLLEKCQEYGFDSPALGYTISDLEER